MIKHLHDGGLSNTTSLEVFHTVLASQSDCLDLCNRVSANGFLLSCKVDHVSNEDLDWHVALRTLVYPLFNLLERCSLGNVEQEETGGGAIDILVNVFMVTLLAWHIEVDDLVLISIVDIVSCLDVELGRLLIFYNGSKC